MNPSPSEVDCADQAIRGYLASHPRSADTVEGVHEWWLDRAASIDATECALERLAAAGVLERIAVANRLLWRLPIHSV